MFRTGQRVLAFHGPLLYEAKVLESRDSKGDTQEYFIHYKGWKSSWDEWVVDDRLLDLNDENLKIQKELREAILAEQRMQSSKKVTTTREESVPLTNTKQDASIANRNTKRNRDGRELRNVDRLSEEPTTKIDTKINIPDSLKSQLVDDWENVTKNQQLVSIPRSPNVVEIIEGYRKTQGEKRAGSAESEILDEILAGLKDYFDLCFGTLLLYKFERQQYLDVRKKEEYEFTNMSELFGAEHLLRLFVSMPKLLADANMDYQSVQVLRTYLEDFLLYMEAERSNLFLKQYENASPNYHSLSRGI